MALSSKERHQPCSNWGSVKEAGTAEVEENEGQEIEGRDEETLSPAPTPLSVVVLVPFTALILQCGGVLCTTSGKSQDLLL